VAHDRAVTRELPAGTVTFLFTDVEGSTRLLQELGAERYAAALQEHRRIVRDAAEEHGGVEVDTQGDALFVAFPTAPGALAAATTAAEGLRGGPVRVRISLHTGTPYLAEEGYVGVDVHRAARIAAAGHGGQVLVSTSTAALVDPNGLRDLGEHRLRDLSAPERIFQLGWADFPPLRTLPQTNLPVPATPFLGRGRELAEVAELLTRDHLRLVTLTGPGGTGKTRLALQAAGAAAGEFADGIWWVPLAALQDSALVTAAAAQAMGAKNELRDHIRDRRLLLLLDSFEHVVDAADELAALLAACPNLQLLVTSRELLSLPGEHAYPVGPLEPTDGKELFLARAQAALPGFERSAAVAELCTRLEQLPLALELAAARVRVLSPEQLLARLGQRLDLLKAGRGVDPRQQTLRATIEWSHELLGEDEQRLFARLAVFSGGSTLEAVEEVCGAEVDTLQGLVDKSLLRRVNERFWMLETIRDYAAERLEQSDEGDEVRRRHADHFLAVAEAAAAAEASDAPDARERARRLAEEFDNLRAAVAFLCESGDVERELRLVHAIVLPLWERGRGLRELYAWAVKAVSNAAATTPAAGADALADAGFLASLIGDRDAARRYARESLALSRDLGDRYRTEWALRILSFEEADPRVRRKLLREGEALLDEHGDERQRAWISYLLGQTALDEKDHDQARALFETAATAFRQAGREREALNADVALALALVLDARAVEARAAIRRSLQSGVALDAPLVIVESVETTAALLVDSRPDTAARLLAAAAAIRAESGEAGERQLKRLVADTEAAAREALGERVGAVWREGESLSAEEAAELALASL
jgi:predicted ATPase/class 3 adenylate cyclase